MNEYLEIITNLISRLGNWGYALMAVISFLEAFPILGFFLPGVVILIFGGVLVAENVFDFFDLVLLCAVATFLGDLVAFTVGRRISLVNKKRKLIKDEYLVKANEFIAQHGSASIFWGRFVGPVRPMIYFVAGASKLTWLRFILSAAFSGFIFSLLYLGLGYVAGSAWQTIEDWSGRLTIIILSFIVLLLFGWWFKNFLLRYGRQLKNIIKVSLIELFMWYQSTKVWHWLIKYCPTLSQFFIRLTNPQPFFGLRFFILILINLLIIIALVVLVFLSSQHLGFVAGLDERFYNLANLFFNQTLAVIMFLLTNIFSVWFVGVLSLVLAFWFRLEKRKSYIVGLMIAIASSLIFSFLIKIIMARPRPLPTVLFENSYAFPSLHAALALAFLFYLSYYAIKSYPRLSRNISLFFFAFLLVLLVGLSRIYLGVHYFSDVLGGYLLGLASFILGVIGQHYYETLDRPQRLSKFKQVIILSGLSLMLLTIYLLQIFTKASWSDFYSHLISQTTKPVTLIINNQAPQGLLITENLRGGRQRPLSFAFNNLTDRELINLLTKAGWQLRDEPELKNIIKRGLSFIFKTSYEASPVRPRFWNNKLNFLALTKKVARDDKVDVYFLRLWFENESKTSFVGELFVNEDMSWPLVKKDELLNQGKEMLVKDILAWSKPKDLITSVLPIELSEDKEKESNFILYNFVFE